MTSHVAIIGCGLIGRAWAISFLRGGCAVWLWDAQPGAALRLIESLPATFHDLRQQGLLKEDTDALLSRLTACDMLDEAVDGADHVQENTPEELDSKRDVLARIDDVAHQKAIIASSTSGLLPSSMFQGLRGAERCLVAHPINPPFLVPAVEIVPGPDTAESAVSTTAEFMTAVGQTPIVMKREIDGFVMNRLQGALLDEAFALVAEGYASPHDIDAGIREGLALRWSFMGPFETIDLNAPGGVRDYVDRYGKMYARLAEVLPRRAGWDGAATDRVEAERRSTLPLDRLGDRQNWRDRRLMALAAHKERFEEGENE